MRRSCLVLVVALALLPAPEAGAQRSAIHPQNRPTGLPGETNGEVRPEALLTVEDRCRTAREAGPSLALMLAAARADGVALTPRDCYRPRTTQAGARTRACAGGNCACAAPAGGSMHGWGKAVDFRDGGGTVRFTSEGYRWLTTHAARYGWNHPGWARPGGSACPEAWHWEWVGDGGNMGLEPIRADVAGILGDPRGPGYWVLSGLGGVVARGEARPFGSARHKPLDRLIGGGAVTPTGGGYWLVASDGGVFTFGDAAFLGSLGDVRLNRPIVGMAPTPSGAGYWLVASDGGVFTFGDAHFAGSLGGAPPAEPVVGISAASTGRGYWLATAAGEVFPFGAVASHGNLAGVALNLPVVGMAATPGGGGYWLVGADGGVFAFGDARFHGAG